MSELMALVARIERETPPPRALHFGLSANVTVDILEIYLRRQALLDGYRAVVHAGSYEDHLGTCGASVRLGLRSSSCST
jgi:hypothetical protein